MTPEKCKNCPAVVYPYRYTLDYRGKRLPKEGWIPTCMMNLNPGADNGMYADCFPSLCQGVEGKRYRPIWNENKRKYEVEYE